MESQRPHNKHVSSTRHQRYYRLTAFVTLIALNSIHQHPPGISYGIGKSHSDITRLGYVSHPW